MQLWIRQIAAVLRLEMKKTFFSKRGWWIYCLAAGPVLITLLHWWVFESRRVGGAINHRLGDDSIVFAALFQFFYLRATIFFGCMGIFSNLFRGEMLEKTLHYYYLMPMRRELLVLGKYLAGLVRGGWCCLWVARRRPSSRLGAISARPGRTTCITVLD